MGKNKFQVKHVALLGILVLGVSLSVGYLSYASVLNIPSATGPNDAPRSITGDAFAGGIDLGAKTTNDKGEPIPLIPKSKFDGVNAQFWANSNGSAQIPDDAIVHGIADSRNGFINTAQAAAGDPSGTPQPVYIYDNLWIKGNAANANEPGNLLINGQISNPNSTTPVMVNDDLKVMSATAVPAADRLNGAEGYYGNIYLGSNNNTAISSKPKQNWIYAGPNGDYGNTTGFAGQNLWAANDLQVGRNIYSIGDTVTVHNNLKVDRDLTIDGTLVDVYQGLTVEGGARFNNGVDIPRDGGKSMVTPRIIISNGGPTDNGYWSIAGAGEYADTTNALPQEDLIFGVNKMTITKDGDVKAFRNFGRFYRRSNSVIGASGTLANITASCASGDILTGCNAFVSGGSGWLNGAQSEGLNCWGRGMIMNAGNSSITAYATCFSPDGVVPTAPGGTYTQETLN